MFWRGSAQVLDVGCLQQFGEDVGIGSRGRLSDEVGGGTGRGGRFREDDEGFQGIEGFLLEKIHFEESESWW